MPQKDISTNYALATDKTHTMQEFILKVLAYVRTIIEWQGPTGTIDEVSVDKNNTSDILMRIDPLFHSTKVELVLRKSVEAR